MHAHPIHTPIGLSSCWNSHRHTDGYKMLEEMAELGFQRAELSHGVQISLVEGILAAIQDNIIEVHSVHNFCPLPPIVTKAAPNIYQPTSYDVKERALWIKHTQQTLEFAAKVHARCVVLHLGSVHFNWLDPVKKLEDYYENEAKQPLSQDIQYLDYLTTAIDALRKKNLDIEPILYETLSAIIPLAQSLNLKLGIENREGFHELPLDEDIPHVLEAFESTGVVGYWHDAGHAALKSQAGFIDIDEHLSLNGPQLIGCHLHDVIGEKDHRSPGTGMVDFSALKPYLKSKTDEDPIKETVLVMELSPHTTIEAVLEGHAYLKNIFQS